MPQNAVRQLPATGKEGQMQCRIPANKLIRGTKHLEL
jgi:hypothetical protein